MLVEISEMDSLLISAEEASLTTPSVTLSMELMMPFTAADADSTLCDWTWATATTLSAASLFCREMLVSSVAITLMLAGKVVTGPVALIPVLASNLVAATGAGSAGVLLAGMFGSVLVAGLG